MATRERLALYPGTFDPITFGHLDLVQRSVKIFDRVLVGVAQGHHKSALFSLEERIEMMRECCAEIPQVEVAGFSGLLVDFARETGAAVIVRGLRAISDFEYEFQMALMNRKIDANCEVVFLMPSEQWSYLNSSVVKEIARLGGRIDQFAPASVVKRVREKLTA
ncbi:MAG: pantetheine-phosphate adenylyltransferase [bacterium]